MSENGNNKGNSFECKAGEARGQGIVAEVSLTCRVAVAEVVTWLEMAK